MSGAGTSSIPTEIATAPSSAATSSTYPPCAQLCLADATASLPCAETNSACLCLHASTVKKSVTSCLSNSKACLASEADIAASYYDEVCLALGYPTSEGQAASAPIMTASGRPTVPTQTPSSTASDSSTPQPHTSLSVPTIAGIAAGAAFILICVVTVLLYLYVRRRSTKPSNPTVTIESPDPSNPKNRLHKTVSLRQSALFSPDDPEWNEKLSHIATLARDEKYLEHNFSHIERKKSLPQTPPPVYTKAPIKTSPHPSKTTNSVRRTQNKNSRPPSIIYPSPFNPRLLFERSISNLSNPISGRPSTPQVRAPSETQFSDKGSIYSATTRSSFSDMDFEEERDTPRESAGGVELARGSTSIMHPSCPTTLDGERLAPPAPYTTTDTLRPARPPFLSQFSSDTTIASTIPTNPAGTRAAKPAPLTLRTIPSATTTSSANLDPFSEAANSPVSPISPISVDVSAPGDHNHTVSGASFGRFDFESASGERSDRTRESFMGNMHFGSEKL